MTRFALFPLIALLSACGGNAPTATDNEALAAESRAGYDGDIVELPGGEGETMANLGMGNESDVAERADDIARADGWIGRWRGVEGLNLVIARADAPGRYTLEMQYSLDQKGSFEGTATAEGIAFTRPDGEQVLKATDGDATGLKWLAGKKDCLTVKSGEGYCRD